MPAQRVESATTVPWIASARIYGIFLLSGAAALVYQVIWARWLGLVFGNTTTSISIILGAFMLGLALGSRVAGAAVRRIVNPMRTYAILELGIGVFALLFPLATAATDRIYGVLASTESPESATIVWRVLLAFLLLLLPTSMMGATLPLLTEHFRRAPEHDRTWRAGVLYAANTIGAALGVIAASFIGIELLGVRATTVVAAALNFLVAILGFYLARGAAGEPFRAAAAAPRARTAWTGWVALLALGVSGGLALASEVLWTRTLQIVVGNSTYAFATILVVYLVGVALGSAVLSGIVKRSSRLEAWLVLLLLGMGVWTLLASEGFGFLQAYAAGGNPDEVQAGALLLVELKAAIVLLPLAILSGGVFPVATRLLEPEAPDATGEQVARAYTWNTIGAVAGSLIAGFVVAARFDYLQAIDLLAAGYALAAASVAVLLRGGGLRLATVGAALVLALPMVHYGVTQAWGKSRFVTGMERGNPDLVVTFHEPGLQGITTVFRRRGEEHASGLLVNAQGMTTKVTVTKMMAHLPILLHREPRRVLVICFGMGTTFRSALSHDVEVTSVELVPEVLAAFPHFFGDADRLRSDPRGRLVATDGRNFLQLTRESFDVITLDPPPPIDAAGVTNLYSREFAALARQRLAPGGIFAHWIPFPGIRAGVESVETMRMLLATIAAEFPHVLVLPGVDPMGLHVLASEQPIEVDLAAIERRIADPAVAADLNEWQRVPPSYFAGVGPLADFDYVIQAGKRRMHVTGRDLASVATVSDDRPRLEFDLWRSIRAGSAKILPGGARP